MIWLQVASEEIKLQVYMGGGVCDKLFECVCLPLAPISFQIFLLHNVKNMNVCLPGNRYRGSNCNTVTSFRSHRHLLQGCTTTVYDRYITQRSQRGVIGSRPSCYVNFPPCRLNVNYEVKEFSGSSDRFGMWCAEWSGARCLSCLWSSLCSSICLSFLIHSFSPLNMSDLSLQLPVG